MTCPRLAILCVVLLSTGCGGASRGYVSGTVTLDGQPLSDATVEFQPDSGTPSYGETNGSGRYTLALSADEEGAVLGMHTIRVSTFRVTAKEDGSRQTIPEQVPDRFNANSTMKREVTAGRQTIDIEMTSGP